MFVMKIYTWTKIDLNHDFNRFFFRLYLCFHFPGKLGLWEVPTGCCNASQELEDEGNHQEEDEEKVEVRNSPADRKNAAIEKKLGRSKQQDKSWRSIKYFLHQLQKLVYHRSCRNLTNFFCHMSLLFMLRLPNKYVPHQMTTVTSFSDVTSWDVSFFSGSSRWNFARNVNPSGWLHWRGSPKAATAFAGWDLKPKKKIPHQNAL